VPTAKPFAVRRAPLLAVMVFLLSLLASPAAAEHETLPQAAFVPETGQVAEGLFLVAWRLGPEVIGRPITGQFPARAGFMASPADGQAVQFFQHLALVWSPDAPMGSQVQPLPLGERALDLLFERNPRLDRLGIVGRTACPHGSGSACRGFVGAGQTLREPFLPYWNDNNGARWLGEPVSEAFRAPDRSAVQYFEFGALRKGPRGIVSPMPIASMMAREMGLETAPLPQPAGVPVFDESLFAPLPAAPEAPVKPRDWVQPAMQLGWIPGTRGPGPQTAAAREIVVSISQQSLWAYENGELIASTYVSTGAADLPETVTPIGQHIVLTKYDKQTMEGVIGGEAYKVPDVPDVMYFDNLGNALHGAYWHSEFGTPRSHGCVNLPLDIAAWLYDWTPIGTPVTVVP